MNARATGIAAAAVVIAMSVVGCGSGSSSPSAATPPPGLNLKGDTIQVAGVWSGAEQADFQQVLQAFENETGATVQYTSDGDNLPTVLQTKVAGKNPPNIAFLAQPGSIAQFAKEGALKPLPANVQQTVKQHQATSWNAFATVDNQPYGVYFDASDKSVVWYNAKSFSSLGAQPPTTWSQFVTLSSQLADAGITPMSVGAADGWVLTDWFEQVYLQTAGAADYDKLGAHQIPWTDPTVTKALQVLQQYLGQNRLIAGGDAGALQTDFPTSVVNTFSPSPKAAMVYEGDFVATTIQSSTDAKVGTDAKIFPFPQIGSAKPGVETGGDAAVAFTNDKATMALMNFLATPQAGAIFAKTGGFLSPDKDIPLSDYPNDITRTMEQQLLAAGNNIVFDMSDQAPPAFGATKGSGEWQDLENFLANTSDINGAEKALEADAVKDYPTS
ncbi:MAG TPA: carbohydrate ABC transporter substrate-binding protein [Pseudonocardiaceae bacterium]|jgi:maltose-binding protein MalE|nr:carbohydrate ABC transporter substrate-binding protein [Pseudonocardiaceae bacterium]